MSGAVRPSSVPGQTCPTSVHASACSLLYRNLHFKKALCVAEDMVCHHGNEGDVTGGTSCFWAAADGVGESSSPGLTEKRYCSKQL